MPSGPCRASADLTRGVKAPPTPVTSGPLVCIVDDARWLDHASLQAVSFVARRLAAEPIAIVFAVDDSRGDPGPFAPKWWYAG